MKSIGMKADVAITINVAHNINKQTYTYGSARTKNLKIIIYAHIQIKQITRYTYVPCDRVHIEL